MILRHATIDDLTELCRLARHFGAQVKLNYRWATAAAIITSLVTNDDALVLVAELPDGSIAGSIAALIVDPTLTGERVAQEMYWFADPSRSASAGIRLLKAFEAWAFTRNCDATIMATLAHSPPGIAELYQRKGYELLETQFIRRFTP